jgi:hypothetical protein
MSDFDSHFTKHSETLAEAGRIVWYHSPYSYPLLGLLYKDVNEIPIISPTLVHNVADIATSGCCASFFYAQAAAANSNKKIPVFLSLGPVPHTHLDFKLDVSSCKTVIDKMALNSQLQNCRLIKECYLKPFQFFSEHDYIMWHKALDEAMFRFEYALDASQDELFSGPGTKYVKLATEVVEYYRQMSIESRAALTAAWNGQFAAAASVAVPDDVNDTSSYRPAVRGSWIFDDDDGIARGLNPNNPNVPLVIKSDGTEDDPIDDNDAKPPPSTDDNDVKPPASKRMKTEKD